MQSVISSSAISSKHHVQPSVNTTLPSRPRSSPNTRYLGPTMLLRGFITTAWHKAMKAIGVSKPESITKQLLLCLWLWDNVVTPLWEMRNDILHHSANLAFEAEDGELKRSLIWYMQHKREILSIYDHDLIRFNISDLHTMSCRTKREWKRHLDTAREAWVQEKDNLANSQQVITRFLRPLRHRRSIGTVVSNP